jgi:sulfite exporter TauE/SafE
MLRDHPGSTFLFGFSTLLLPCGQTVLVFSACALSGGIWIGLFNGFAFALLTTPSLWLAMNTLNFFKETRKHYQTVIGWSSIGVGVLALCRGLADLEWIPHLVLKQDFHLILF